MKKFQKLKKMLQVAPPSTKGYFLTIFIKYLSRYSMSMKQGIDIDVTIYNVRDS